MATTPTLHLRCTLRSLNLQRPLFKPTHSRPSHLQPQSQPQNLSTPPQPFLRRPALLPQTRPLTALRFASDTTTHPASTHSSASSPLASNPASIPAAAAASPIPPSSNSTTLTWNTYLSLRRLRRRYSLLASLLTSTSTTAIGLITIERNMDALGTMLGSIFGVDPIFMLGIATVATGGVGWLLGPFVGEGVFRMVYRREWGRMAEVSLYYNFSHSPKTLPPLRSSPLPKTLNSTNTPHPLKPQKEKDFYFRIRKHRVDPSLASYSNPLPDYYGEKIGSVQDFRTWMRDQRAYNRKRMAV
ncbi:MAG: hypothetical protein L6R40_004309 [Gallowayella cf. fulva]|nr:MAG: hypothetical protein L6R40_004309 [Xanthomendoza cf. fulva]